MCMAPGRLGATKRPSCGLAWLLVMEKEVARTYSGVHYAQLYLRPDIISLANELYMEQEIRTQEMGT